MDDIYIPLDAGGFALDLGDNLYGIFDEEGIPLGFVQLDEGEDIVFFDDFDNVIPLANVVLLNEGGGYIVAEETTVVVVAEELEDINIDVPTGVMAKTNPQTGNTIIISTLFGLILVTVAIFFKRRKTAL